MKEKHPRRVSHSEMLSLLILSKGSNHGYGILSEIGSITEGRIRFPVASVYETLGKLVVAGSIQRIEGGIVNGRLRQRYNITELGKEILIKEMQTFTLLLQYYEQDLYHPRRNILR